MARLPKNAFVPSNAVVQCFRQVANGGSWIDRLLKWLSEALYSQEATEQLLSAHMEDALIAFAYHKLQSASPLRRGEEMITDIFFSSLEDETVLKLAIQERLPRVEEKEAKVLAELLFSELQIWVQVGKEVWIDGGVVNFMNGQIHIRLPQGRGDF